MAGEAHTVLMLGSSGMVFTDTGPSGALPKLLEAELSRRVPNSSWLCDSEEIPPARDLPQRVRAAVEARRPSVMVMDTSPSYFTYDYVVAGIRRRWPALFGLSRSLSEGLKATSGRGFEGSPSPRGLLFRAPRTVVERLIGAEPYMKVENAIDNVRAALEYLAAEEGLVTVFKLPTMAADVPPHRAEKYAHRLAQFHAAISETCDAHGIPYYEHRAAGLAEGFVVQRVEDGLHSTLETRAWDASHIAGMILERMAASGEANLALPPQ